MNEFCNTKPQKEPITSGSNASFSVRYGKTSAGKSQMVLVFRLTS